MILPTGFAAGILARQGNTEDIAYGSGHGGELPLELSSPLQSVA